MIPALILVAVLAFLALGLMVGAIDALAKLFDSVPWGLGAMILVALALVACFAHP